MKVTPADRRNLYLKANTLCGLANLYGRAGRPTQEAKILMLAEAIARDVIQKWPGDLMAPNTLVSILLNKAEMERRMGHLDNARRSCKQSLAVAADLTARSKDRKDPVSDMEELRAEAGRLHLTLTAIDNRRNANITR